MLTKNFQRAPRARVKNKMTLGSFLILKMTLGLLYAPIPRLKVLVSLDRSKNRATVKQATDAYLAQLTLRPRTVAEYPLLQPTWIMVK
jgi:hypothetical protein